MIEQVFKPEAEGCVLQDTFLRSDRCAQIDSGKARGRRAIAVCFICQHELAGQIGQSR